MDVVLYLVRVCSVISDASSFTLASRQIPHGVALILTSEIEVISDTSSAFFASLFSAVAGGCASGVVHMEGAVHTLETNVSTCWLCCVGRNGTSLASCFSARANWHISRNNVSLSRCVKIYPLCAGRSSTLWSALSSHMTVLIL